MSIGFQHPNVRTHIGDGFKFLADKKNEFDVIITDSSDPAGPAESLFQKPYFELLHDALREGGVITTQGNSFLAFPFVAVSSVPSRASFSPLPNNPTPSFPPPLPPRSRTTPSATLLYPP